MKTKSLLIVFFIVCSVQSVFSQDYFVSTAPEVDNFSIANDPSGAATNTVDLYTGSVKFPLSLVSVPAVEGLGINISAAYSSIGVTEQKDIWNLDAPTGVMGLGWNIALPKIVADNKTTGTREDDTFYLVEGGMSNLLILKNVTGSYEEYETKIYNFWKIKYYPGHEKWEITKEDGKTYVYGDQYSGRSTVQWIVKWGNWIGSSAQTSNQQQQVTAWNLSEVIST